MPASLAVLLVDRQVHKLVKFRPRGMVDKREMEQAQLFDTADERGCAPMFGAAHRRESARIGGMRSGRYLRHVVKVQWVNKECEKRLLEPGVARQSCFTTETLVVRNNSKSTVFTPVSR